VAIPFPEEVVDATVVKVVEVITPDEVVIKEELVVEADGGPVDNVDIVE
jgi:hypothetical protein